jgi:WD40 repeat protein
MTDLNDFRGVNAVRWSPDGKSLSSVSNDKTVRIWDASTGQVKLKLSGHNDPVRSVCFSPCDTKVVSGGGQGKDYGANEDFFRFGFWT